MALGVRTRMNAPCDRTRDCPAQLHYDNCSKVAATVERQQRLHECARHGHDWSISQTFDGVPRVIHCDRCGKRYKVVE